MSSPPPDRTGYLVSAQGGGDVEVTFQVHRDADGVGLGAYASPADIDTVIAADRAWLASR